jgi:hypothetical protein
MLQILRLELSDGWLNSPINKGEQSISLNLLLRCFGVIYSVCFGNTEINLCSAMLFILIALSAFFLSAIFITNEGVFEVLGTTYSVAWAFLLKIFLSSPHKSSWTVVNL